MHELTAFRRLLHAHPELSNQEFATQQRIRDFLANHTAPEPLTIATTGLIYPFRFGPGPHVLVRVDIDALPITETNVFEHASTHPGVAHKCGHDGHATIGVGLVQKLVQEPLKNGSVSVLFQPAEEVGEGAQKVLNDSNFQTTDFDFALALHNIPGEDKNKVLWKHASFTPAVHSLIIRLQGITSHAAEPLKGINPAYALAAIIDLAKNLEETDESHPQFGLITPVYSSLGSKDYGISAGHGEIHFTMRSWEQHAVDALTEKFLDASKTIAQEHQLEISHQKTAVFASNYNNKKVVDAVIKSAKHLQLATSEKKHPFPWGEDFGLFTQSIPGAMFGLGAGKDTPPLHNPEYDYPDDLTPTAIQLFYSTLNELITA